MTGSPRNDDVVFRQRRILWLAITLAVLIYAAVTLIVVGRSTPPSVALPAWLFPVLAVAVGGAAVVLHPRLVGRADPPRRRSGEATTMIPGELVVWCLDEAVAVIGLVAAFLTGSVESYAPYAVVALALLVFHRPQN